MDRGPAANALGLGTNLSGGHGASVAVEALRHAYGSVKVLAAQYGSCSTEVAHELQLLHRLVRTVYHYQSSGSCLPQLLDRPLGAPGAASLQQEAHAHAHAQQRCSQCGEAQDAHAGSVCRNLHQLLLCLGQWLSAESGASGPHGHGQALLQGAASAAAGIAACIMWQHYGIAPEHALTAAGICGCVLREEGGGHPDGMLSR